ncbi:MAG: hypothetical protein ACHQXA_07740 [Gemmatimonadales bacterium]
MIIVAALLAVAACASKGEDLIGTVPAPAVAADSVLHIGATVRVHGARLGRAWRVGTVVVSAGTHPCLAIKLISPRDGSPVYVGLNALTELNADGRTNNGLLTMGLPAPQESDWAPVNLARAQSASCRRARR